MLFSCVFGWAARPGKIQYGRCRLWHLPVVSVWSFSASSSLQGVSLAASSSLKNRKPPTSSKHPIRQRPCQGANTKQTPTIIRRSFCFVSEIFVCNKKLSAKQQRAFYSIDYLFFKTAFVVRITSAIDFNSSGEQSARILSIVLIET